MYQKILGLNPSYTKLFQTQTLNQGGCRNPSLLFHQPVAAGLIGIVCFLYICQNVTEKQQIFECFQKVQNFQLLK